MSQQDDSTLTLAELERRFRERGYTQQQIDDTLAVVSRVREEKERAGGVVGADEHRPNSLLTAERRRL